MDLPEFAMERLQSLHEKSVRYDLSESGVEALTVGQVAESMDQVAALALGYGEGRGTAGIRARIAAFHPGAQPDDVLLTTGTSEANHLSLVTLLGPGDRVVVVMPAYLQAHGIVRGLGAEVAEVWLREEDGWRIDLAALEAAVGPPGQTTAICVCQPNNPTAQRLSRAEVSAIARIADAAGTWIHSDEVFRGAELDGIESPSFAGSAARVIVTGGLSKVYGLPGLRIGWIVAPPDRVAAARALQDYTTIAPATLSALLAEQALARREALVGRARTLAGERWPLLAAWAGRHSAALRWTSPAAGTVCLFRYRWPIDSVDLAERLIREGGTLLVPGAHFGAERQLRIGFGMAPATLAGGLAALDRLVADLGA